MPNGKNSKEQISIYVDPNLIVLLDKLASKNERSRSVEAERAIRKYILEEMDSPSFWQEVYQKHGLVD